MEAKSLVKNHKIIFAAASALIGACALSSTFSSDLYEKPALVVFTSTALCMWSFLVLIFSQLSLSIISRIVTVAISAAMCAAIITASPANTLSMSGVIAICCASVCIAMIAVQHENKFAYISLAAFLSVIAGAFLVSDFSKNQITISVLTVFMLGAGFTLIRFTYMPVVISLSESIERAEIFSTITKSSREFHSREPEEAIRNIVNVTKTLGYISVSVVSFDRRQKIFEDGVPIPNVMDIAVRASATRRVIITRENEYKKRNSRSGDIVGVPIWINGRYSAALIVQTSPHVKVTQKDSEALELLADQAGRALENAGKAAMDRRVVERLTDESQRDKLTGLGNRRFADAMIASMRPGDVVAMIDLDGLKSTNDYYGHASGDELLHEVGVFLAEQIRNPDMAARLGGDEFMILLRNAETNSQQILERILVMWREKKIYNTTFSIGMAVHRADKTHRETVEAADEALYGAKKAGKDRLVLANVAA